MKTICKINGIDFGARVSIAENGVTETFNVLDGSNSGRSLSGDMIRDVIGTYILHKVTFFNTKQARFDELWDYLVQHSVDDYVEVELADGQSTIKYNAYYTTGSRKLVKSVDNKNYWDELTISFVPIGARLKK